MPVLVGMVFMAIGLLLGGAVRAQETARAALDAYRTAAEKSTEVSRTPAAGITVERTDGDGQCIERITAWRDIPLCLFLPGSPVVRAGWTVAQYDPAARIRQVDAAVRLAGEVFGRIRPGVQEETPQAGP